MTLFYSWNVSRYLTRREPWFTWKINRCAGFAILVDGDSYSFHETWIAFNRKLHSLFYPHDHGAGSLAIVSCTQGLSANTSEYTPNLFRRAQPTPQLTIPTRYHSSFLGQTSGPPLSPRHASTPPRKKPAQRMRPVMRFPPYDWRQVSRDIRGTLTCCKI